MSFSNPWALLLLLALPYFYWVAQPRSGARGQNKRGRTRLALRLAILCLLILGLAGLRIVRAADNLAVVFLLDHSDSVTPEQRVEAEQFVRQAMENMSPADAAAVIVFGANALVDRPMSGLRELPPLTSVPQSLHSDLAEAIRLGLALFPAGVGQRLVILSDGAVTTGNTQQAVELAAASGAEITFVPLGRSNGGAEARLTEVQAPNRVSVGEIIGINVSAASNANLPATLRVLAGGQVVYEEPVQLRRGNNNFTVRFRATAPEFIRYTVELSPAQDTYSQNNRLAAFTDVVGPPRVLLVASAGGLDPSGNQIFDESPALRQALEGVGLEVERTTPEDLPATLQSFTNYAAIVLVDVNAKTLSPRKMRALQSYVRDLGGGLVAIGGPQSFGMGGYYRTPLEELLPVEMQIKDQERFPSVSMVIVIDRSGSMAIEEEGVPKIQLADEAAARVVELLNDFDEITIIPVDTQPAGVIGPVVASDKDAIISEIYTIGAGGGGINVRTGLEAAAAALANTSNQVRHIIVLADGSDSNEQEGVPELIDALTAGNVTVSMVSIGQGKDVAWLRSMADRGNGRFHLTETAATLPQIFTQETVSIQRSYLVEERFFPALAARSPILANIDAVPPLFGYVGTSPKAAGRIILETHLGDPLLAAWQYGLGRSVAWTSDATGRWGEEWVRWEGFPTFWAQAVRWTIGQGRNTNVQTSVVLNEELATLTVDVATPEVGFVNNLEMTANVIGPDGDVVSVPLAQTGPGRYLTQFAPDQEGAYLIRINGSDRNATGTTVAQTTGWVLGYSPEYENLEPDVAFLESLAAQTGGRSIAGEPEAAFAHTLAVEQTSQPIWSWLMLIAVLLLPVDIAARRLAITGRDMRKLYERLQRHLFHRAPVAAGERSAEVARLFEAKQRAAERRADGETAPFQSQAEAPAPAAPVEAAKPDTGAPVRPEPGANETEADTLASRLLKRRRDEEQK